MIDVETGEGQLSIVNELSRPRGTAEPAKNRPRGFGVACRQAKGGIDGTGRLAT